MRWDYKRRMRKMSAGLAGAVRVVRLHMQPAETVFTDIYRSNRWGDVESRSGPGSTVERTQVLRTELANLLKGLGVRSLLDIPCGDLNWMQYLKADLDWYIGADIVRELVALNQHRFGRKNRRFVQLDLTRSELPDAALILCRDCLTHFSQADVRRALANVKRSRACYFLTTSFFATQRNRSIATGQWQPLNLQRAPFHLPAPLCVISDKRPDGSLEDKVLALWRVKDLP